MNQYQQAWMIRADGDKKVYEVDENGVKKWLNITAEQFSASGRLWEAVYIVNNFERIAKNLPLQDAQDLHDRLKRYFNSLF